MSNDLREACSVELVSGPTTSGGIDSHELAHARRALARLKSLVGHQGLLDLLAEDITEGNAFFRELAARSDGQLRSATTVLAVRGQLKAAPFLRWLEHAFSDENVLLAAEPEHYVFITNPDGSVTVVENLGPYVASVRLPGFDDEIQIPNDDEEAARTVPELLPVSQYPFRRLALISLPDGTAIGRMLIQCGDTGEGFSTSLTVYFPSDCPDEVFEGHLQHLAVEFRNWIVAAAAAQDCTEPLAGTSTGKEPA